MRAELEVLLGEEYEGVQKYSTTYQGQDIKIYERMDFRIVHIEERHWETAATVLTLGSWITGFLGLPRTAAALECFAVVFDVVASVDALLPGEGDINIYNCYAYVCRYASINGSDYPYSVTDLEFCYKAYEDADLNSSGRAAIDRSSLTYNYPEGSSFYNDYDAQVEAAYEMFCRIGQQD